MRVVIATILGLVVGNGLNMMILRMCMKVEVAPGGDEYAAMLKAIESFTAMDYMIPLAAHVFGVLAGLLVARLISRTSNVPIYIIGGLHMLGTVINIFMIPAPGWFVAIDLIIPIIIIIYFLRSKRKK